MTHHPHGTGASKLMRAHHADDRRRYHRFDRHGLVARIGSIIHEVEDVSVGGLRLKAADLPVGQHVAMTLIARDGTRLDISHSMPARGEVVSRNGAAAGIRFTAMTYTLAKFLIQHLARRHGVQPYIFR